MSTTNDEMVDITRQDFKDQRSLRPVPKRLDNSGVDLLTLDSAQCHFKSTDCCPNQPQQRVNFECRCLLSELVGIAPPDRETKMKPNLKVRPEISLDPNQIRTFQSRKFGSTTESDCEGAKNREGYNRDD
jgi:hypothetical protein